jgi:acyl carrier protein
MASKQEVLRSLREQTGDRKLTYDTRIEVLQDRDDLDMLEVRDGLETEFGIELADEMLVDLDTVGDLCELVVQAHAELGEPALPYGDEGDDEVRYTRL